MKLYDQREMAYQGTRNEINIKYSKTAGKSCEWFISFSFELSERWTHLLCMWETCRVYEISEKKDWREIECGKEDEMEEDGGAGREGG